MDTLAICVTFVLFVFSFIISVTFIYFYDAKTTLVNSLVCLVLFRLDLELLSLRIGLPDGRMRSESPN